jgi:hypothetical protein
MAAELVVLDRWITSEGASGTVKHVVAVTLNQPCAVAHHIIESVNGWVKGSRDRSAWLDRLPSRL